ncbi:MAG: LysM peptidoglycan-binding domain-containing protein [Candidatus Omnitrophota bacterium]
MKKYIYLSFLIAAVFLAGCIVRTASYEVDRVDQELSGNRGILAGSSESISKESAQKKTKKMYGIEIELPSSTDKVKTGYKSSQGNKGYMVDKKSSKETHSLEDVSVSSKDFKTEDKPKALYQDIETQGGGSSGGTSGKEEKKTYVVQKGDTLQKISQKMYGTVKLWKKIYEKNKDTIKSPDTIKPGQKLIIPAN